MRPVKLAFAGSGCKLPISRYNGAARRQAGFVMVGPAGPLATISREPGQARKGAAAAVTLCAGVWLVGFTSMTSILYPFFYYCPGAIGSGACSCLSFAPERPPSLYSDAPTRHTRTQYGLF